jgi:hypothetical protein
MDPRQLKFPALKEPTELHLSSGFFKRSSATHCEYPILTEACGLMRRKIPPGSKGASEFRAIRHPVFLPLQGLEHFTRVIKYGRAGGIIELVPKLACRLSGKHALLIGQGRLYGPSS